MKNLFQHDYDLEKLQRMKVKRFGFELFSTPRFRHAFQNNVFEEMTALLIRQNVKGVGTFIDVGAQHGFYSVLAGLSNPGCRILSFEPVTENCTILKKNLEANTVQAEVIQKAVSNESGRADLQVSEAADGSGFIANPAAGVLRTTKTDVIALDQYLPVLGDDPVLIKVGTEGNELKILEGMQDILSKCRDVRLVIEFNPCCLEAYGNQPIDLLTKLTELGLEIYFLDDEQRRYDKYHPGMEWKNLLDGKKTKNLYCLPKQNALNLCFFSHSTSQAGAEHYLLELVDRLSIKYGTLCTVVLPGLGALQERLEDLGAATMIIDYKWWCAVNLPKPEQVDAFMQASYQNLTAASNTFARVSPDAILTNTMVIPWGAILAQKMNLPHIWMVRELGYGFEFYYTKQKSIEIIQESSNQVLVPSEFVRKALFKGMKPQKCIVGSYSTIHIRNATNTEESYFLLPKALKVVISGSVLEFKGQDDAIHAVKRLLQRGHEVELCILGDTGTPFSSSLKKLVDSENLGDRIHFINFLEDVFPVLEQADIGLSCSRYESLSRSVIEAMLLGKPVIGTRVGGIPELITDGYNGWLYTPGDVDQLAGRMEYFIEQPGKLRLFGERARETMAKKIQKNPTEEIIYQKCRENRDMPTPISRQLTNLVLNLHQGLSNSLDENGKALKNAQEQIREKDNELMSVQNALDTISKKLLKQEEAEKVRSKQLAERNKLVQQLNGRLQEKELLEKKIAEYLEEKDQALQRLASKVSLTELLSERVGIQLDEKEQALQVLRENLALQEQQTANLAIQSEEKEQAVQLLEKNLAIHLEQREQERAVQAVRLAERDQAAKALEARLIQTSTRLEREIGSQMVDELGKLHKFTGALRRVRRRLTTRKDLAVIVGSGLFDRQWYLARNPDVTASKMDPAIHYLRHGGFEGRDPGPGFSSDWYLKEYPDVRRAKVNPLLHFQLFGKQEGRAGVPPVIKEEKIPGQEFSTPLQAAPVGNDKLTVFSICAKNFTAYARTLYETLERYHPGVEFILFLCDEPDAGYDIRSLPFKVVLLDELYIPDREEMSRRYNITEFNTAIKPYAFAYLFKKLGREKVIYFDPDIIVLSPLQEVLDAFSQGAECVLTPHILEPAEKVHFGDNKFLQYGIFNLGFIGLRNTAEVLEIVEWWGRRLVKWCVIDLPNGFFVDQKWVDLFPAFLKQTTILHHPGYNVGYWNLSQRKIERINGSWYSNGQPLRFVHFSGHDIHDPHRFTRHIPTETRDTIGDLKYLVDWFHERLFANDQEYYSKLPYSYSWNGASGVNLHTPQPIHQATNAGGTSEPKQETVVPGTAIDETLPKKQKFLPLLRNAAGYAGGWSVLVREVFHTFKAGGLKAVRERALRLGSRMDDTVEISFPARIDAPQWMPRILIIDWTTPRPDQDAGSLSTFNLMKVYVNLGYDVTFIPGDLQYLGEYTDSIRSLGVRCLLREDIGSVEGFLQREGGGIHFVMLCRAPVAAHFIPMIRRHAPQAKILLNTIDMHYLREMREAELDGSPERIHKARRAKEWELDIMRRCDVTIVLSSVEYQLVREELPDTDIRLIPLLYVDTATECPPFKGRKDILFIGGFPHTPNIDAVIYFCEQIFPLVKKALPKVKFHIVGNAPPPEVLALEQQKGVIVHGFVKDVAPLFQSCRVSVAPLRYGAGIKGKIATSLAFGLPVIATSLAVEGMDLEDGMHVMTADEPQQFADALVRVYKEEDLWDTLSRNGREQVARTYSIFAIQHRIESLMRDLYPLQRKVELHSIRSRSEHDQLLQSISNEIQERDSIERTLLDSDQTSFSIDGFCAVCGCDSGFKVDLARSSRKTGEGKPIPEWRDQLVCEQCGFPNHVRAFVHFFTQQVKPGAQDAIYVHGLNNELLEWWQERYPRLIGSSFQVSAIEAGLTKSDLRKDDLIALSYLDRSFDHVLAVDGLDKVNDAQAAFREIHRCLKPGGTFMFSVPFLPENLVEASNPKKQASSFRHFSWDVIKDLEAIGFTDAKVLSYWSRDLAYLGGKQFLLMCRRGALESS